MVKVISLVLLLAVTAAAQTAQDLVDQLRVRAGEVDTATSMATNSELLTYLNHSQDKINKLVGYLHRQVDIYYKKDSLRYTLPSDFKYPLGVTVYTSGEWEGAIPVPFFVHDSATYMFFVEWRATDTAEIYLRGSDFTDDQLVRVFYAATAPNMDSLNDTCMIAKDDRVYLIEEALGMYEAAKRSNSTYQQHWQNTRLDIGVIKPPVTQ